MLLIPDQGDELRAVAEHIGHVVMAAVALDSALALCLVAVSADPANVAGLSGRQLSQKARLLAADLEVQTRMTTIADRYDQLYDWRNQIVHGGYGSSRFTRINRTAVDSREVVWDEIPGRRTPANLVALWYDLTNLRHEILQLASEQPRRS